MFCRDAQLVMNHLYSPCKQRAWMYRYAHAGGTKLKIGAAAFNLVSLRLQPSSVTLALRHVLPVERQILRKGHAPEKIVQNLCVGNSRQVPENLCERCAGAPKHVLRLCEICAGVHLHNSCRVLGWGFRESACTNFAQFPLKFDFAETKLYGQKMPQLLSTLLIILF